MTRAPAGRLNGVHAPVGTILGPKVVTRELVVVTFNDDAGVTVGYATPADIADAFDRDPRSVAEAQSLPCPRCGHLSAVHGSPVPEGVTCLLCADHRCQPVILAGGRP